MSHKKYQAAFEIEAEIIRHKRNRDSLLKQSDEWKQKANVEKLAANNPEVNPAQQEFHRLNWRWWMHKSDQLERSAYLIQETKLSKLKEALAEMNTETFMFSKNDRSVVLK